MEGCRRALLRWSDRLSDVDLRVAEALLAWVRVERGCDQRRVGLILLEESGVMLLDLLLKPLLTDVQRVE